MRKFSDRQARRFCVAAEAQMRTVTRRQEKRNQRRAMSDSLPYLKSLASSNSALLFARFRHHHLMHLAPDSDQPQPFV
ncbi:hypothetical protein N5P37_009006 [Trichoderma harzianum]|nr:hypothetical protein N5P37_009006 [Trichoderma harzianum]